MQIFFTLLLRIIPLYILIILGLLSAKLLKVHKETVAVLLIYLVVPVVVFNGVYKTHLNLSKLSLPILFYIVCCCMCLLFYRFAKLFWTDSTKNILAFGAGSANSGYLGLPVAIALFGDNAVGPVVLCIMGFTLYENTLGFYITARSHFSVRDSIQRLIRLPTVYTFFLAVILNLAKVPLGEIYENTAVNFQATYSILGMMIIGMGLAGVNHMNFDGKYVAMAFLAKFIVWPLIIVSIIILDSIFFQFYDPLTCKVMVLMSIVPMAANTVAYAALMKVHPEKAAVAVLLSTLVALFTIPLIAYLYFLK